MAMFKGNLKKVNKFQWKEWKWIKDDKKADWKKKG